MKKVPDYINIHLKEASVRCAIETKHIDDPFLEGHP